MKVKGSQLLTREELRPFLVTIVHAVGFESFGRSGGKRKVCGGGTWGFTAGKRKNYDRRPWLRMLVSCRVLAREHGVLVFTASDTGTRHGNICLHPNTEEWGPEDWEFKVILHYTVSSRLVWATQDPVFPLPSKKEIAVGRLVGKC